MRHASRPASFLQPGGRGFSERAFILEIIFSWSCLFILLNCFLCRPQDIYRVIHESYPFLISFIACSKGILSCEYDFA